MSTSNPSEAVAALDPDVRRVFQTRLRRLVAGLERLALDCDEALGLPPGSCNYYLADTSLNLMAGASHTSTDVDGNYTTRPQERQDHVVAETPFPGTGGGW